MLKNPGPYQIIAEFLPANNYYAESTSAPIAVTINPTTMNAPTVTSLQAVTNSIETGEPVVLNATVQNANSSLANGVVEFEHRGPAPDRFRHGPRRHVRPAGQFGELCLQKVGTYQVEAVYLPNTNRFAESTSAPVTVTVTPLTAASFRVTPVVRHGHLAQPLGFTVTALNVRESARHELHRHGRVHQPHRFLDDLPETRVRDPGTHRTARRVDLVGDFQPVGIYLHDRRQGSHTFLGARHIR